MAYSKVNSKELACEIVQDIFSNIWEKRNSLQIEQFSNYLSVCVKYGVINKIKKEANFSKFSHLYRAFVKISEEDTWKSVQYNDLATALEQSMVKLPEKTQKVFALNRLEGKSIPEIASALHLSEKAIQYHLHQSQKKLRLYLKDFLVLVAMMLMD